MKPSQGAAELPDLKAGHHVAERANTFFHLLADTIYHRHDATTRHEPTVVEIVDRVTAMHCGESCDVELDSHITRIKNLEKLLPICVQQFGRSIAMRERSEGDKTILTITVTAETGVGAG